MGAAGEGLEEEAGAVFERIAMTAMTREFLAYIAGTCWGIFGGAMAVIWCRWRNERRAAALCRRIESLCDERDTWHRVADDRLKERRGAA